MIGLFLILLAQISYSVGGSLCENTLAITTEFLSMQF